MRHTVQARKRLRAGVVHRLRWCMLCALVIIGWCLGGAVRSAEPPACWCPWRASQPSCPCCPDDYHPKKAPPCPPHVCSHAPNDYCPKTLPGVARVKCGDADDYCSKPCRFWLPSCAPPWYTCGCPAASGSPPSASTLPMPSKR